jgi:hypothetical protein
MIRKFKINILLFTMNPTLSVTDPCRLEPYLLSYLLKQNFIQESSRGLQKVPILIRLLRNSLYIAGHEDSMKLIKVDVILTPLFTFHVHSTFS